MASEVGGPNWDDYHMTSPRSDLLLAARAEVNLPRLEWVHLVDVDPLGPVVSHQSHRYRSGDAARAVCVAG